MFALIALVLPASAKVVSCLDHVKENACCMSHGQPVAKKLVSEPVSSCCTTKTKSDSKAEKVVESKSGCHCKIKSAPTKPLHDPVLQLSSDANGEVSYATGPFKLSSSTSEVRLEQAVFFNDSSPPDEPLGSSHDGRAPPVSGF
ncbi:MAG: hypothetical protein WCI55_00360 [Armatimonadota bacterium]